MSEADYAVNDGTSNEVKAYFHMKLQLKGGSMTKSNNQEKRLAWTTPELRRIDAGSAEGTVNQGAADGQPSEPQKS